MKGKIRKKDKLHSIESMLKKKNKQQQNSNNERGMLTGHGITYRLPFK